MKSVSSTILAVGLSAVIGQTASAWTFSADPVCTLRDTASGTVLTYDGARYRIAITAPRAWPDAPVFTIRFAPDGPVISTTRHRVAGATLSVEDRGFGNVLDGLQYNDTATAIAGPVAHAIDLDGAAEPTAAFRACTPAAPSV